MPVKKHSERFKFRTLDCALENIFTGILRSGRSYTWMTRLRRSFLQDSSRHLRIQLYSSQSSQRLSPSSVSFLFLLEGANCGFAHLLLVLRCGPSSIVRFTERSIRPGTLRPTRPHCRTPILRDTGLKARGVRRGTTSGLASLCPALASHPGSPL
jgi:hypothetical protein